MPMLVRTSEGVIYLGYAGTTAVPFMDYLLADRIVIPEEHRIWRRWIFPAIASHTGACSLRQKSGVCLVAVQQSSNAGSRAAGNIQSFQGDGL
jgi:hypothetical protein